MLLTGLSPFLRFCVTNIYQHTHFSSTFESESLSASIQRQPKRQPPYFPSDAEYDRNNTWLCVLGSGACGNLDESAVLISPQRALTAWQIWKRPHVKRESVSASWKGRECFMFDGEGMVDASCCSAHNKARNSQNPTVKYALWDANWAPVKEIWRTTCKHTWYLLCLLFFSV